MEVKVESLIEGLMVYWTEVKMASRYYVHLLIGDKHYDSKELTSSKETYQEVKLVECDRHTKIFSFTELSYIHATFPGYRTGGSDRGLNYYVIVEAEGKDGSIIDQSGKILGRVRLPYHGHYLG